jgi:hypothetical protein
VELPDSRLRGIHRAVPTLLFADARARGLLPRTRALKGWPAVLKLAWPKLQTRCRKTARSESDETHSPAHPNERRGLLVLATAVVLSPSVYGRATVSFEPLNLDTGSGNSDSNDPHITSERLWRFAPAHRAASHADLLSSWQPRLTDPNADAAMARTQREKRRFGRRFSEPYRMKIAIRMMIGIGTPRKKSSNDRMGFSWLGLQVATTAAERCSEAAEERAAEKRNEHPQR